MANKALWEALDNIHVSYDDYDYDVLVDQIQTAVGDEYLIDVWDHDDYAASDIVESVICWTNDNCKHKVLEDLQVGTLWTEEEDKCFTIVILKAKEV